MKKIPMILLAMFTLSGCDRQEMIYSFNHVEEASVDNEVENTESVDNIQAETEQAVEITTEEPEISDVYSGSDRDTCHGRGCSASHSGGRKLSGRGWLL